jgi:hypothetical protein
MYIYMCLYIDYSLMYYLCIWYIIYTIYACMDPILTQPDEAKEGAEDTYVYSYTYIYLYLYVNYLLKYVYGI